MAKGPSTEFERGVRDFMKVVKGYVHDIAIAFANVEISKVSVLNYWLDGVISNLTLAIMNELHLLKVTFSAFTFTVGCIYNLCNGFILTSAFIRF